MKRCKTCISWLNPHQHANGIYGWCQKYKCWCNENYYCYNVKGEAKNDKQIT